MPSGSMEEVKNTKSLQMDRQKDAGQEEIRKSLLKISLEFSAHVTIAKINMLFIYYLGVRKSRSKANTILEHQNQ